MMGTLQPDSGKTPFEGTEAPSTFDSLKTSRCFDPTTSPLLYIQPRIEAWTKQLRDAGLRDFRWGTGGAIAARLFDGSKNASESRNPRCPYEKIVQWDGRIFVPDTINPRDRALIGVIENNSDLVWDGNSDLVSYRWGQEATFSRFFFYEDLRNSHGRGVGFEYEVRVLNAQHFLEVAKYWPKVFHPEESQWQSSIRSCLREQGMNSKILETVKKTQVAEACWRVVAHYATSDWLRERKHLSNVQLAEWSRKELDELDFLEERLPGSEDIPPKAIQTLAQRWTQGYGGAVGLDKPPAAFSESILAFILSKNVSLLVQPEEPTWVKFASVLQRYLRNEATFVSRE